MRNPFARKREDDAADALRRRLAEQARQAPSGEHLAELIIARAEAQRAGYEPAPRDPSPARRPWFRIAAVTASAAVVAGAGLAIATYDPGDDRQQAGRTDLPTTTAPTPRTTTPSPSPTAARPTRSEKADPAVSSTQSLEASELTNVDVLDITFTGGGKGWGLSSADCIKGDGTCTALLRTSDDGRSWRTWPHSPFRVPGVNATAPLVTHLRFATDRVGYAFGPDALLMTTDGGETWKRQPGGADALETLDGNVIRVRSDDTNCVGACEHTVQTAAIGSTDWTTVSLPGDTGGDGAQLSRTGSAAYLLVTRGMQTAASLWSSDDDGATWTARPRPCGDAASPRAITTAADGAVVVLCRLANGGKFVGVSTDGASSFRLAGGRGDWTLGAFEPSVIGAASKDTVLASLDGTYRSTDGGQTFDPTSRMGNGVPGELKYLGFASATDAHAISVDGSTIWTTSDAGRTWTAAATFR